MLPFCEPTAYGLGKAGWVSATPAPGQIDLEMFKQWIDESYRAQAPKKLVAQLDGGIATVALITTLIVFSLHSGEIWLARVCGFPLDWRMPFALIMRDLMLPVMFIDALIYDDFVWHGAEMTVREAEETTG